MRLFHLVFLKLFMVFLEHFSVQYTAMTVKTYFLKKIFIFNLTFVVNLVQKFSTVDVLGDH